MSRWEAALGQLLELSVLLNDDMTQRLSRDGLTVSRVSLLWQLRAHGATTQRTLADALGVSARTVTGLVDGLADSGFVTREAHPTDRRATLVTFTERGQGIVEALEKEQAEFTQQLFGGMSPERFDGLVAGLDDVLTTIRALLEEAS
jgi:DNA-binding MarR family transcriptional regulator